ncbi:hypothetical protein GW17_00032629 [Ensete ventricosum]|nr:hypothetical protein GW17_00032629 [Ensete ventricosum]
MYRPDRDRCVSYIVICLCTLPYYRPLPDGTIEIGVSPCGNKAMRRCLLSPREDKAPPHLPAGERGTASSSRMGTRRRLVFQHENEAMPRLPTRG